VSYIVIFEQYVHNVVIMTYHVLCILCELN